MFGEPVSNPRGWGVVEIQEIADVCSGSTPSRDNPEYFTGSIPWVKTGEVDFCDIYETAEHITDEAVGETSCKILPKDTILVAMYGQGKTRGKSAVLRVPATTNQACAAVQPSKKYNTEFLYKTIVLSYNVLREQAKGGNQPNLNLATIKKFVVMLPPLDLQNQFGAFSRLADKYKFRLQITINELEAMYRSILTDIF
jgi:type I restriction enzyme S subunit